MTLFQPSAPLDDFFCIAKKKDKTPEKLNWPSGALKMLRLQVQILSWAKKKIRCLACKNL